MDTTELTDEDLQRIFTSLCQAGRLTRFRAALCFAPDKRYTGWPVVYSAGTVSRYLAQRACEGNAPLLYFAPRETIIHIIRESLERRAGVPWLGGECTESALEQGVSQSLRRIWVGEGCEADYDATAARWVFRRATDADSPGGVTFTPPQWPLFLRALKLGCLRLEPGSDGDFLDYAAYPLDEAAMVASGLLQLACEYPGPAGPLLLVHANDLRAPEIKKLMVAIEKAQAGPDGFTIDAGLAMVSEMEKIRRQRDMLTTFGWAMGWKRERIGDLWREQDVDDGIAAASLLTQVSDHLRRLGLHLRKGRPPKK